MPRIIWGLWGVPENWKPCSCGISDLESVYLAMYIRSDINGSSEWLKKELLSIDSDYKLKGVLVLACDGNNWSPEELNPILESCNKPVFGGLFPGVLYGNEKWEKGTLVIGFDHELEVMTIPGISSSDKDFDSYFQGRFSDLDAMNTMLIFMDGFSLGIESLVDSLFFNFGLEFNYMGGGAGSLSLQQTPCIITNEGLLQDACSICVTKMDSGIGVKHGWKDIYGPIRVTESFRNEIRSLDWRLAFDIYREVVEVHSGRRFKEVGFSELAKSYPFGLSRLGAEWIVRDPLKVDDQSNLICVGEIPEGSFLYILHGDKASIPLAAKKASSNAFNAFPNDKKCSSVFVIDCISRALFLEDDFGEELKAIDQKDLLLFGALTFGEIANNKKDNLEFYNKSIVVGFLE